MSRTAYMITEGQNYYQANKKRVWLIGAITLFLIILLSLSLVTKTATAQRSIERVKLVASIEIQKGDSLWSIASEYMSEEYDDMNDYIEEIKDSNGMVSDEIHSGNYIIVPYYADVTNQEGTSALYE